MIAGTEVDAVISILEKMPLKVRNQVTEITLDLPANMRLIAKKCFPYATRVTDRFTHLLYLNFGIRDIATLSSSSKISLRSFATNRNQIPLASNG